MGSERVVTGRRVGLAMAGKIGGDHRVVATVSDTPPVASSSTTGLPVPVPSVVPVPTAVPPDGVGHHPSR